MTSLGFFSWVFGGVLALKNEDLTQVNFSCNGDDYNGLCMLELHRYRTECAAVCLAACVLFSFLFFLGVWREK